MLESMLDRIDAQVPALGAGVAAPAQAEKA
jgi:hypothetical protein